MTLRIEPLSDMTQKIELFFVIWPQRLNFSDVTQRIEHFFECESKNWTFYQHDSKNWTLKFNLTQRIEPSSQMDSKNWTLKRLFQKCITVLWLMSKSSQVFESCKKSSILWVIFKKGSIIWSEIFERVNSLIQIWKGSIPRVKKVQFLESCKTEGSILFVMLKRRVQICVFWKKQRFSKKKKKKRFNSLVSQIKKCPILWVILSNVPSFK